jgi:hypothetical protein
LESPGGADGHDTYLWSVAEQGIKWPSNPESLVDVEEASVMNRSCAATGAEMKRLRIRSERRNNRDLFPKA